LYLKRLPALQLFQLEIMSRLIFLVVLPIHLLVSCAQPIARELPPAPEIVTVALTPALRPAREAVQACADTHPDLAVSIQEISPRHPHASEFDLFIQLGEPQELASIAAPLALERVVVIVNASNPLNGLLEDDLKAIYSGDITRWSDIGGPFRPIQVWVYPESDEVRAAFDETFMEAGRLTSQALLAPDAAAMLETVSEDIHAIGYLPAAWLDETVREVELDPRLSAQLQIPLLALAPVQPSGAAGRLLYCLQQGQGQDEMLRLYEK
jgi:hypothetical protein